MMAIGSARFSTVFMGCFLWVMKRMSLYEFFTDHRISGITNAKVRQDMNPGSEYCFLGRI